MIEYIEQVFLQNPSWFWIIGGIVLIGAEMLLPGVFFLWIGIAAVIVGGTCLFIPLSLSMQFLLFAILAPLVTFYGKRYFKAHVESDAPLLNARAKQMVGRVLVLSHPIVDGKAQVIVGDSVWTVEGPDLPKGASVIIISVQGNVLQVRENKE